MLSVVVPMFNEVKALPHLVQRLRPVLDDVAVPYEVVCVDDGSTDATLAMLHDLSRTWPQIRVVPLRRNSGHQGALAAGLDNAHGDWIVTLDADLQDPPEQIPHMLEAALTANADVVYGVRTDRASDTMFKRVSAGLYYRIMRRTARVDIPRHAGDFRLMSARAVSELTALPERGRVYRLLIPYMGFRSATVEYTRESRVAGESKYPLNRMLRLATDSYFSFTTAPLRFAAWVGLLGFVASLGFAVFALMAHATGSTLPGWTSVAIVLGFASAGQFMFLGLLGEYIGRIYIELQGRPRYFADAVQDGDSMIREAMPLEARRRDQSHRRSPQQVAAAPTSGRPGDDPLWRSDERSG